ncbi:hypothetical protein CsSME_00013426 [Camellia sinensis var. sinensis]
MGIFSWNCRGLGHLLTVRAAKQLTHRWLPNLIFFSETKQLFKQLDFLGMSLGYRNSVGVDCNGSRGGLWSAWDDCQHITSELEQKIRRCARPVAQIGDFNEVRSVEDQWSPKFPMVRVLVSSDWFEKFSNASLMVLPIQRSNHGPLVFDTDMVV